MVKDAAPLPPSPSPTLVLEQLPLSTQTLPPAQLSPVATSAPSPSPSPAPTPTPIIHVVEPGDTVLGIAAQYNVTADAIQLANPGLRPELLQIDQRITIPPPTESQHHDRLLLPSSEQLPLTVQGFDLYETPVGGLLGLGEVRNGTEYPAENVSLIILLYSPAGDLLRSIDAWTAADLILPGDSAPFGVLITDPPEELVNPQVVQQSGERATRIKERFADLHVSSHQGGMAGSIYRVTGIVTNVGQQTASEVKLVITLYDADKRVTGFRETVLPQPLAPGNIAEFDVWLTPGGKVADHHSVTVTGRADQPIE
jgi:LysM repeat protein